jgi:type I restriction enzyme S subunit
MNAEQLITHFDRISEAPDAIPRLRRLILAFAVRGRLAQQDTGDEPASKLLKQIQAEKAQLVKEGKIRKDSSSRTLHKSATFPFSTPDSWVLVRLGDVINLVSGQHLQPGEYSEDEGLGIPYITGPADFGSHGLVITRYARIRKAVATRGQVLLTVKGAGVGKTAICDLDEVAISRQLMAITAIGWDQRFLLLTTHRLADALKESARSLIPGIAREDVEEFAFPLPPMAEQHRIVTKVDELMALCHRLEVSQAERENRKDSLVAASLHRVNNGANQDASREHSRFYLKHLPRLTTRRQHIEQLRQTILNLAVCGRLVLQDLHDEPASQLLHRLRVEKEGLVRSGQCKRSESERPIAAADFPLRLPDGWECVRVNDLLLGDSQNGYSKKPDNAADGVPILRISAGTARSDGIVAEEDHKLIGGVTPALRKQYSLQPGDLLACRFNGNRGFVGRLSLYLGYSGIEPIYPDKLIRLRLVPTFVQPRLLRYFSESDIVRENIQSYSATTVGNWGISAANLKRVMVPIPPLAEQERIVRRLDELMGLCNALEQQLLNSQAESRRLLESVLQSALSNTAVTATMQSQSQRNPTGKTNLG